MGGWHGQSDETAKCLAYVPPDSTTSTAAPKQLLSPTEAAPWANRCVRPAQQSRRTPAFELSKLDAASRGALGFSGRASALLGVAGLSLATHRPLLCGGPTYYYHSSYACGAGRGV